MLPCDTSFLASYLHEDDENQPAARAKIMGMAN